MGHWGNAGASLQGRSVFSIVLVCAPGRSLLLVGSFAVGQLKALRAAVEQ